METTLYKVEIRPGLRVDIRGEGATLSEAHLSAAGQMVEMIDSIRRDYLGALHNVLATQPRVSEYSR